MTSARQFTIFRIVFGIYLAVHFASLLPYGAELFSREGVLPSPELNFTAPAVPDALMQFDSPSAVFAGLALMTLLSISFAAGYRRQICSLLLWAGWAWLFNRNNLISNPSIPYVGLMLLYCALIPSGESSPRHEIRDRWILPRVAFWGGWFLLCAGYSYSGYWKLLSPSWQNGTALEHILTNPLARPGFITGTLLALPPIALKLIAWSALAGELLALPLMFTSAGRKITWFWMMLMHAGILLTMNFADLTLGMIMMHLFTFDPKWMSAFHRRCRIITERLPFRPLEVPPEAAAIAAPLARRK